MGKILTQEQVDSFHRDGFLSPIDIFSEEEALNYRNELNKYNIFSIQYNYFIDDTL